MATYVECGKMWPEECWTEGKPWKEETEDKLRLQGKGTWVAQGKSLMYCVETSAVNKSLMANKLRWENHQREKRGTLGNNQAREDSHRQVWEEVKGMALRRGNQACGRNRIEYMGQLSYNLCKNSSSRLRH